MNLYSHNIGKTFRLEADEVWFTSDCHYNHDKDFIWKPRGYNSTQEHNQGIINKWNESVSDNGIVFNLGDPTLTGGNMFEFASQLNFKTMYLMAGNHGAGAKQILNVAVYSSDLGLYEHLMSENKLIILIPNYFEAKINNKHIVMCHYPLAEWNRRSHGTWQLHGHCHGSLSLKQSRQLDVGMDNYPHLINFNQIKEKFNNETPSTLRAYS